MIYCDGGTGAAFQQGAVVKLLLFQLPSFRPNRCFSLIIVSIIIIPSFICFSHHLHAHCLHHYSCHFAPSTLLFLHRPPNPTPPFVLLREFTLCVPFFLFFSFFAAVRLRSTECRKLISSSCILSCGFAARWYAEWILDVVPSNRQTSKGRRFLKDCFILKE